MGDAIDYSPFLVPWIEQVVLLGCICCYFLIDICGSDPPVGAIVQVLELVIDVTATNLPHQAHDIAVIKDEKTVSSSNTLDDTPHQT